MKCTIIAVVVSLSVLAAIHAAPLEGVGLLIYNVFSRHGNEGMYGG